MAGISNSDSGTDRHTVKYQDVTITHNMLNSGPGTRHHLSLAFRCSEAAWGVQIEAKASVLVSSPELFEALPDGRQIEVRGIKGQRAAAFLQPPSPEVVGARQSRVAFMAAPEEVNRAGSRGMVKAYLYRMVPARPQDGVVAGLGSTLPERAGDYWIQEIVSVSFRCKNMNEGTAASTAPIIWAVENIHTEPQESLPDDWFASSYVGGFEDHVFPEGAWGVSGGVVGPQPLGT